MNKGVAILVAVLIFGGVAFFLTRGEQGVTQNPIETSPATEDAVEKVVEQTGGITTVEISASNFKFDNEEIRVKKGDVVRINLKVTEGFHDWVVDEFAAKTAQVKTGEVTTVDFVADKEGVFEYYCSVGSHRQMGMVGKLIVE